VVDTHYPYIDLPRQFCREESGEPMQACVVCQDNVLAQGVPYMIDKAYRCGQLLYEAVVCQSCLLWLEEARSPHSRRLLEAYVERHNYREMRYDALLEWSWGRIEPWIARCGLTGRPLSDRDSHQLQGVAVEDKLLLLPNHPIAMSDAASESIWRLLSDESAALLYSFANDYLGVPPALLRGDTAHEHMCS
jgi:hypothetical protein